MHRDLVTLLHVTEVLVWTPVFISNCQIHVYSFMCIYVVCIGNKSTRQQNKTQQSTEQLVACCVKLNTVSQSIEEEGSNHHMVVRLDPSIMFEQLTCSCQLRWITLQHLCYITYHRGWRNRFFKTLTVFHNPQISATTFFSFQPDVTC